MPEETKGENPNGSVPEESRRTGASGPGGEPRPAEIPPSIQDPEPSPPREGVLKRWEKPIIVVGLVSGIIGIVQFLEQKAPLALQSGCEPVEIQPWQAEVLASDYAVAVDRLRAAEIALLSQPDRLPSLQSEFRDVARAFDRVLDVDPNFPAALVNRGTAVFRAGDLEQAEALLQHAISTLTCIERQLDEGRPASAFAPWLPSARITSQTSDDFLRSRIREDRTGAYYNLACVYSVAGDFQLGFETLSLAIREGGFDNRAQLHQDMDLHALRADDGWEEFIKKHEPYFSN